MATEEWTDQVNSSIKTPLYSSVNRIGDGSQTTRTLVVISIQDRGKGNLKHDDDRRK